MSASRGSVCNKPELGPNSFFLPLPVPRGGKLCFIMASLPTVGPQREGGGVWKPVAVTHFLEVLGAGLQTPTAQLFGKASWGQARQLPKSRGWLLTRAVCPHSPSLRLSLEPLRLLGLISISRAWELPFPPLLRGDSSLTSFPKCLPTHLLISLSFLLIHTQPPPPWSLPA